MTSPDPKAVGELVGRLRRAGMTVAADTMEALLVRAEAAERERDEARRLLAIGCAMARTEAETREALRKDAAFLAKSESRS